MTDEPELTHDVASVGAFSISLPVADLAASIAFYEHLGFTPMGGEEGSWSILKNGLATIGLFHGMFDKPMLTFNPGWDQNAQNLDDFTDVRAIRNKLIDNGLAVDGDTTQDTDAGPAEFVIHDPDGNPILIDQHR